jgi:hypothetical protein
MAISRTILFLTLLPVVTVALYVSLLGVNIPFWDQWIVLPLLIKKSEGLLSLADLLAQHNEHRPLFPRLIWLWLSGFTHYNVKMELWANLALYLATFSFFIHRTAKMWQMNAVSISPYTLPLLSLLMFNLGQYESWLQGFQTVMFLGICSVVVGLFLVAEKDSNLSFSAATVLGVIAAFSMANGLLYWPIGLGILLLSGSPNKNRVKIFVWLVVSALSIGLFFKDWVSTGHLDVHYAITHPLEWMVWILSFLGAPIMAVDGVAWIFGLLSFALYVVIIKYALRTGKIAGLLPHLAVSLFILVTVGAISLGRIKLGLPQSTVSRYLTMSAWYWASLLSMLPLLPPKKNRLSVIYGGLAVMLLSLTTLGGYLGYKYIHYRTQEAYEKVVAGEPLTDEVLLQIYPVTEVPRNGLKYLQENKLSLYVDPK